MYRLKNKNNKATLVLVGSGIKFLSHLTTEARTYIENSDKVLYLVNDPAMQEWINLTNPNSEALDSIYTSQSLRSDCYQAITEYILKTLNQNPNQNLCVVLYGHPTVFSQPGLKAVIQARNEGYDAKILPGISAEDCLYADLLIDPSDCGCQSFEATELLIHKRQIDPSSHLILWQVGVIGLLSHAESFDNNVGASALQNYLSKFYQSDHPAILYEAAQYPHFEPLIRKFSVATLTNAKFSRISTLYIPPRNETLPTDHKMLDQLNMHK